MPIPVSPPAASATSFPGDWTGFLNEMPFGGGPPLRFVGITGWRDMSAAPLGGTAQLQPRSQSNGSYSAPYFMPARVVTLQFAVEALPGGDIESTLATIEERTQPSQVDIPLSVQMGGISTAVYGKVSSRIIPTGLEVLAGFSLVQIEVTCADPRRFGDAVELSQIRLPSSSGGLTWPVTWPISWPSTVESGSASLVNEGNTAGPVTLRIDGPVTAPEVVHVETGTRLAFSSALTVAAGDWLDIDCEARTVLYNGQASRNAMLISRGWPTFQPGANTFHFNASSYSSVANLRVTALPSYI